jgi:hypothetical protein
MFDDVQREVAVHLLANALRRQRIRSGRRHGFPDAPAVLSAGGQNSNDEYLRGMIDLITALYGRALADELYREASTLENPNATG